MKSTEKVINFFENYTRTKYFTDRVLKIRNDIGIPQNGIDDHVPEIYSVEHAHFILGITYKDKVYPTFPAKMTKIYSELLKPVPKIYGGLLTISITKSLKNIPKSRTR